MNRSERRAQNRERITRGNRSRSVSLHIDELVLHGFPRTTRYAIGEATQAELGRLFHSGLPDFAKNPRSADAIDGGAIHVTQATQPVAIGNLIANAVYGGRRR